MKTIKFYKLSALPLDPEPDAVYYIKSGSNFAIYVTDSDGNPVPDQAAAGADAYFTHVQLAASSTWSVNHLLGKKPSVMVVDSGDSVVIGDITYIDDNNLEITFTAPFGGKAYMS